MNQTAVKANLSLNVSIANVCSAVPSCAQQMRVISRYPSAPVSALTSCLCPDETSLTNTVPFAQRSSSSLTCSPRFTPLCPSVSLFR